MDRDFLLDLFAGFGPVTLRRMFSGYGVSRDGINFALVLRGAIYLRADERNIPQFEAEGAKPFQYTARGKDGYAWIVLAIAGTTLRRHRRIGGVGWRCLCCRGEMRPGAQAVASMASPSCFFC